MFIKDFNRCKEIIAGDKTVLREILNPLKDDVPIGYSLAHAKVGPKEVTTPHKLNGSEVYYILEGEGEMHIDGEKESVSSGQAVCIPPGAVQYIKNTGSGDLVFLCIVEPAWRPEMEEVLQS